MAEAACAENREVRAGLGCVQGVRARAVRVGHAARRHKTPAKCDETERGIDAFAVLVQLTHLSNAVLPIRASTAWKCGCCGRKRLPVVF